MTNVTAALTALSFPNVLRGDFEYFLLLVCAKWESGQSAVYAVVKRAVRVLSVPAYVVMLGIVLAGTSTVTFVVTG